MPITPPPTEIENRGPPEGIRRALLVTVPKHTVPKNIAQDHIDELELLVQTYGVETADKMICPTRKFVSATLMTSGKLEEVHARAQELAVDVVIFDDEISPAQQRNLEKVMGIPVLDRCEVILEVFAQRAQTREARLQIELARVRYQLPRLKRLWTHLSRQKGTGGAGGSGAFTKGEGEKQIEIDRRILKRRIDSLQSDLVEVNAHRETVRTARIRSAIPICALVGYTNAGKSTLMNALTEAGVFVEDKLFATLDTTTRKFRLRNNQEILLVDTVGFIRKLPHHLVAAFRSTLEEAVFADILLHIVDSSNPAAVEQAETTIQVLEELGASKQPILTVLNKCDLPESKVISGRLRTQHPRTVQISAVSKEGLDQLEDMVIEELQKARRMLKLRIPQKDYAVVSDVMRVGQIIEKEYVDNDVLLKVDLPSEWASRLAAFEDKS